MTKRRSSVRKAQWTEVREEEYRKSCEEILFGSGEKLLFEEDKVYLDSQERKEFLVRISRPGSMWYEIWMKLKTR